MRILAILLLIASPASAHDWWGNHTQVDPQTKALCCGVSDCKMLPLTSTEVRTNGVYLKDTAELIPIERVQPSKDGFVWACRWGGETKCFFYPQSS